MTGYTDFDIAIRRGDHWLLPFVVRDAVGKLSTLNNPTGGTFPIAYEGAISPQIAYNASAAAVQAALTTLPGIDASDVSCAGGDLPTAVTITFSGELADKRPWEVLTVDPALLTGGSAPGAEIVPRPADLTAYSLLWFTAKRDPRDADADAVLQLTLAAGGIALVDGANGRAKVIGSPTHFSSLAQRDYTLYADLQGKDGSSEVHTLASGLLRIRSDVTRSTS